jgi:hypothetical protein
VPTDDKTGWKAQSQDSRFPMQRDQIVVNGASGEVLQRFDYSDEHWFNKLTSAGNQFHEAQLFGVPLQIFLTLLAISVIALIAFGYKMWWQRRPRAGMGAPPPIRAWGRNAPLGLVLITVLLAWLLPTLGLSLIVWLVLERALLWTQIARGRQTRRSIGSRLARYDTPLRPGIEAYKAVVLATFGLAMLLAPHIADTDEELSTIPRLLAWAWSRPLGLVFLVAGLIGLYAMYMTSGKVKDDDTALRA